MISSYYPDFLKNVCVSHFKTFKKQQKIWSSNFPTWQFNHDISDHDNFSSIRNYPRLFFPVILWRQLATRNSFAYNAEIYQCVFSLSEFKLSAVMFTCIATEKKFFSQSQSYMLCTTSDNNTTFLFIVLRNTWLDLGTNYFQKT
jgi:hypothetical protein